MSKVFVLDSYYKPLDPVHPGRARVLLKQGKASVYRHFPFCIILKVVSAFGHGCRQMCLMTDAGFPRTAPKAKHFPHEFHTGDIVRAVVPARLKHAGVHVGRMSAKAKGGFTIYTNCGKVTDIGKKYCQTLQHADGYGYAYAK